MTINPATGLPEGRSRFLEAALPALLSIGVGIATGGASIPAQMAAQAAAGYGGAKLMGKDDDEAITSGLVSGATAGLFGGVGSSGGAEAALNPGSAATQGVTNAAGKFTAGQAATNASVDAGKAAALNANIMGGDLAAIAKTLGSDSRSFNTLAADAFAKGNYTDPAMLVAGAGQFGQKAGMNAAMNQMRDDANRPIPEQEDFSNPIDIYSTPFTQTSMGPFNQQQISDNFISGGSGPYGMNFLNQAYGQEGGQVEEMNQGGLTQFNSIMGNPALQLQNPNPPMQMAFGGKLGQMLGMGGGGNEMTVSYNGGPRGSSPGGKGKVIQTLLADVKQQELLQKQPVQPMKGGGAIGNIKNHARNIKEKFLGSDLLEPFYRAANKTGIMKDEQYNTIQGYAGGGMMGEVPPEMLQMLQSQVAAPQDTKSYDVLASIGANPVQAMNQGGMTNAGTANSSVIPAIVPLIQAANEQAQARFARGGEIVDGLKAIAGNSNKAFEGRVKGPGDGMSDDIPFNIEGQQPALLARDEYVIPADVVSMIGNGSSDAGSEQIDAAIANIRQDKYGRAQQPRETEGLGGLLG